MITTLIAAALVAVQPTTTSAQPGANSPTGEHEHGQMGQMHHERKMSEAECAKCCEEMMAKMHENHGSAPDQHKHQ